MTVRIGWIQNIDVIKFLGLISRWWTWFEILDRYELVRYWCVSIRNRYLKISPHIDWYFKKSIVSIKISVISVKILATNILIGYFFFAQVVLVKISTTGLLGYFLKIFFVEKKATTASGNCDVTHRFFGSTAMATAISTMVVNNVRWIQQIEAFNGDEKGMEKGERLEGLALSVARMSLFSN